MTANIWAVVLFGAVATYLTRVGGHLLIRRIGRLPPRLEAALNAVPAAVIATIVAPTLVSGDWPERIALVTAGILSLRLPQIVVVLLGTLFVAGARAFGF